MTTRSTTADVQSTPTYLGPFITVTILFFIFGFITNLNMALVPHLRSIFDLPYSWAMLAESAFFLAYFVFSWPTSKLIESVGYKSTMVVSLFIQVAGCLLFLPAARFISFPLFLTAVFVVGAGVTALQTSANPYIAILGPEKSASVRLNLAQAFCATGGAIAPLVAGACILTEPARMATRASIADTVRLPYLLIAGGLFVLGLAVSFTRLPHIHLPSSGNSDKRISPAQNDSVWRYRHTVLGAVGIFLYVGVEVSLASIAINFFKSQGISSTQTASLLLSLYWFGELAGRLLGSLVMTRIQASSMLCTFGLLNTVMVLLAMNSSAQLAIASLVLCGLFNSIMFPTIFTLGIAGLGAMTSKGSGLIMTAVVGGAVVPVLFGGLADLLHTCGDPSSIQHALALPCFSYLFIAYYGLWGSKPLHRAVGS